ncbi:putative reverse transcriptase domain-containing protein [Tanacetum coccineum]
MPPRMRTRSAGRPAAESRGGGTGERVGRGGRGRGPRGGNNERVDELNGQGNNQGFGANGNVKGVNGNVEGVNGGVGGAPDIDQKVKYTAGSFVGKALTWWNSQIRTLSLEVAISMLWNDFKLMIIEEFCPSHEMQKLETELWNYVMIGAGHAAYTDRFHELARLVPHLISGALIDEAVRNGSIKKVKKRGNVGEPSKDKNGRDDNKMTRTGNAFATTANPVGRENTGAWPKCTTCNSYHAPRGPCRTCFNCNRPGHLARDCRVVPRNVNPVNVRNPTPAREACHECGSTDHLKPACPRLNRVQGPGGNHPNQVVANNGGQGHGNQGNQARGRAFMLGAEEACQDPNIMTTSGQLVEIDKVIKGCTLEIEGHVFDIDLIPFGNGSFDVIIGMDWLSNHKAEINCHKKVVRIPLLDVKVLRVLGERPEEKARLLMSVKSSDKKEEEIVVVRDFPESPYHLAPSKLEELSGQLKELQDKGVSDLLDTAYRTYSIRHIELLWYGVLRSLGTAYWLFGYGVLSYSGMMYCISWVRRIELLGYGVLAESMLFLIFDQSIIYDIYTDVDTAYSSKSGNGLEFFNVLDTSYRSRIIRRDIAVRIS